MRSPLFVAVVALLLVSCSDLGVSPTDPLKTAPTLQMSHVGGGDPATDDLCGGLSPCDAFDYGHAGGIGVQGMCFLPPTVDNHLSDPACSGKFVPGLDGFFKLAWCRVEYLVVDGELVGTEPPTIKNLKDLEDFKDCQAEADWKDLVQDPNGAEHYSTSVRWKKNGPGSADVGDVFRLYIVHGDLHYAHRDVIIDPNLTTPADGFVHSIGFGNEPIKVKITEGLGCVFFDTQEGSPENAATCLIAGETSFSFDTDLVNTTFNFPDGNPTFIADFEVSECLSLGFDVDGTSVITGNALVDMPLADCKISMTSAELDELTVPGQIEVTVNDSRWATGGPLATARLNVLQSDEFGVAALPPTVAPSPNWFGLATIDITLLRWIGEGFERLAALFGIKPAYGIGAGWDFTRMSDFQVALMPVMAHDVTGTDCAVAVDSCLNLGTFSGIDPISVSVKVSAPDNSGPLTYPTGHFAVPGTRLHFFPATGSVACPSSLPAGAVCIPASTADNSTTPPSTWGHLVVVTGSAGTGSVDWTLADGANTLNVVACGVARPGDNEADEPGTDGVWGTLGDCTDRYAAITASGALDNGPADGFTPFEPVDIDNEVAIYGLPLTFEAKTCPQITVDGIKAERDGGAEWEECAVKTGFIAPLKGKKSTEKNAWLYTYDDGNTLYMALEVVTKDLGNKIFINLVENFEGGDGVAAAGDELLVIDFGDPSVELDWHFTEQCVGNNSSSLCGDPDVRDDEGLDAAAAASEGGAGPGRVFYEFSRPLGSLNASGEFKEDLNAPSGAKLGLRLRVTQGQGGGKGGFVFPDPQKDPLVYHIFFIQ